MRTLYAILTVKKVCPVSTVKSYCRFIKVRILAYTSWADWGGGGKGGPDSPETSKMN